MLTISHLYHLFLLLIVKLVENPPVPISPNRMPEWPSGFPLSKDQLSSPTSAARLVSLSGRIDCLCDKPPSDPFKDVSYINFDEIKDLDEGLP